MQGYSTKTTATSLFQVKIVQLIKLVPAISEGYSRQEQVRKRKFYNKYIYICVLWSNFILGLNFIFLCFWVLKCMIMSLKQRSLKFKPRITLNHNIQLFRSAHNKRYCGWYYTGFQRNLIEWQERP